MLTLENIRWKNFLGTGNSFTEIELNANPTTMIVGKNGAGKSTLLDAICFVLYGKAYRNINKPQLINSINKKNTVVEIEFTIGTIKYLIRRGMKPTVFEIYKDGELQPPTARGKDYQKMLEEDIVKMTYKSFCQIIVLGSANFIPFMLLSAAARREVIEDVLDLQIFTEMNLVLREKNAEILNDLRDNSQAIAIMDAKISSHKVLIRKLESDDAEKIASLKDQIAKSNELIETYKTSKIDLIDQEANLLREQSESTNVSQAKLQLQERVSQLRSQLSKDKQEVSFYSKNDSCPTCRQNIDDEFKTTIINNKTNRISQIEQALIKFNDKLDAAENILKAQSALSISISSIQRKISEADAYISSTESYIRQMQKDLQDLGAKNGSLLDQEHQVLSEMLEQHQALETIRLQILIKKSKLDATLPLLSDGGIKSRMVKKYIPAINKLINYYLNILELPIGFELDENFQETIKSRFRDDFSYESFSEGEKKRLDLAILLAWRSIAKKRNSVNCNLLIMDEILDGSLDTDGMEQLGYIIEKSFADENLFIISHRESMVEWFPVKIKFENQRDFSVRVQ